MDTHVLNNEQDNPVSAEEQIKLLKDQHLKGHFGANSIVKALKGQGYRWKNMYIDALTITQELSLNHYLMSQ
ncbi:hypothetical protein BB560_003265 [Smittium megazygosporum]|uniref:Integrase zinc-binding domain-containing protein n=1 Tax=Smittium megazygosporum TaxID=133381 RepID=A0A2T9ZCH1_9FUNG|nr:hypothetical protein BB560_003265 [Smittium megazygosporum]